MTKDQIILSSVLNNLVLGNGILALTPSSDSINYDLMIGMSLSCIFCCLIFYKINVSRWNIASLFFLSVGLTLVMEFIGVSIAAVITGIGHNELGFLPIIKNFVVGIFMAFFGIMVVFPLSIVFFLLNCYWLIVYQKVLKKESQN